MILIISSENDQSTNTVIKWLIQKNSKYIRLGEQQFVNSIYLTLSNEEVSLEVKVGEQVINLNDIHAFWYRKHTLELLSHLEIKVESKHQDFRSPNLKEYLIDEEMEAIRQFLFHELEKKNHLGNFNVKDGYKLISFSIARDCGFKIPTSYVSSSLEWLKEKFNSPEKLIVKPVDEAYSSIYNEIGVKGSYDLATASMFENSEETIYPSSLQSYADKKIELRVFYLNGECYSMAIFSQSNTKTQIDFRNYDTENPNRNVPYKLPKQIEKQVIDFMNKVELKTGSLDLILTHQNEYVFLEVNPLGQYGMVSEPCNYGLDEKIANILLS